MNEGIRRFRTLAIIVGFISGAVSAVYTLASNPGAVGLPELVIFLFFGVANWAFLRVIAWVIDGFLIGRA